MDYDIYHLSVKERAKVLGISAIGIALIAKLFYDSGWILLFYPLLVYFLWRREIEQGKKARQEKLALEFLDALRVVNTSLFAGLSIENAWMEAKKEVKALHGDCNMYRELQELERQLAVSHTVEDWLSDFGNRSGVESIQSFSQVFSYAKRSGGNLAAIVEQTTRQMRQKQDTEGEIQVLVAQRKLEQKIMEAIPLFILAYLRLSSGSYMDALYGNALGICIMTACLGGYGLSVYWADHILQIEI